MKTETKTEHPDANPVNGDALNEEHGNGNPVLETESTTDAVDANAKRLKELARKIQFAYREKEKCDGMVVDWKEKQLKAGIKMGKYLLEAKPLLPPKQFMGWCRDNFDELSHRTLTRYMKLAKHEKHVTKVASGLRQAYREFTDPDHKRKTAQESDFHQIKQHLSKAKNLLNGYPDLIASQEGDLVCDLHDAIGIWVTDYRSRTERHRLNKLRDADFEVALVEDKAKPTVQTKPVEAEPDITLSE